MPIASHDYCINLNEDTLIWRYIDFEKFESLLDRQALFFCRQDKLADPFEGAIPRREYEYRMEHERKHSEYFKKPFDMEAAKKRTEEFSEWQKAFKKRVAINCWHINKTESDLMWKSYLKDNEGVAVLSSVKRLKSSLEACSHNIYLIKVRYLNFDEDIWYHETEYPVRSYNTIAVGIHKRIEFKSEQEYRVFFEIPSTENPDQFWQNQENHKGLFVDIDLNALVHKVYAAPTADDSHY